MSKKVTIKEEDIEAPPEETLEEIVEQVKAPAPTPSTSRATEGRHTNEGARTL